MKLVSEEIESYCKRHSTPMAPVFEDLRKHTYSHLHSPQMQVGFIEGQFLAMMARAIGAKKILEFGTFSGFSTMAMAHALGNDGKIITCDVDEKTTQVAQQFWEKGGQAKKIELRLGPGLDTLASLAREGHSFDMVFIDADKQNYWNYWDLSMPLVRTGGLLLVDNVLWSGKVLNPQEASDRSIHEFNQMASQDPRVTCLMLPIRDGILVAQKR